MIRVGQHGVTARTRCLIISAASLFILLTAGMAQADIVIDNGAAGTSFTGTWSVSAGTGAYGTDSLWARGGATYTWSFDVPSPGSYEVFMWWTQYTSRNDAIPVSINHASGTSQLTINQQINGSQWNSLGVFTFETAGSVTITALGSFPVNTCADAVRIASGPALAADFSAEPLEGEKPLTVQFTDLSTSDTTLTSWQWDFDNDGTIDSTEQHPSHQFTSEGKYSVKLTVGGPGGTDSQTKENLLTVNAPAPSDEIIIDNGQAGTSYTGTWYVSGGTGAYGTNSLYGRNNATYTWSFNLPSAGEYEVFMWWTEFSSRSPSIPLAIQTASGTTNITINQQTNGSKWNSLGVYTFGSSGSVRLSAPGAYPTSYCADAIRVVPASVQPSEYIVDNGQSGTSSTGTWAASGAPDPYGANSLWARNTANYTWRFTPQETGVYSVYMWWTVISSRGTAIPIAINHAQGTANTTINQQLNGGQWNLLGAYNFNAGTQYSVVLSTPGGSPTACADAVRWVKGGSSENQLPTATINSVSPNPAQRGQTVYFSGSGSDSDGNVTAYEWASSRDGTLSSSASFNTSGLTAGTHTISFRVQDNDGAWSSTDTLSLIVTETSGDENIFACFGYGTERVNSQWEAMLEDIGATLSNGIWRYTRAGKTYLIHTVNDVEGLKTALRTPGSHVMFYGHSNYGLGQMFCSSSEWTNQIISEFQTVDDPRILNCSTDTVSLSISGMIKSQSYPNWFPEFSDGSSAIMPYDFGDPRGNPPYNYYLTYRVPGDSTYYRIDSPRQEPIERFPGCGHPAWYSSTGAVPSASNSAHRQYFITNSSANWRPLFVPTSGWTESLGVSGFWSVNYLYTGAGTGSRTATWRTSVTSTGPYNVYARWSAGSDRANNSPYSIRHAGGTSTVRVNQTTNGARWNLLGTYNFNEGTEYPVVLSNDVSSGNVIADAVYVSHTSNPPYVLQSDFYASPRAGSAPFTVNFRSLCTGEADKKIWNFGDGGYLKDSGTSFEHTYTRAGTYSVTLTSSAAGNTQSITKTAYIVVGSSEPAKAEFSASGREGLIPRSVTFANQSSGNISSVLWTFGDGSTSTSDNPTHSYSSPGNYTVSLRVNFTNGSSQTVSKPNFVRATRYEKIFDNITYPPYHYGSRTIVSRGPAEVSPSEMRYNRLFLLSCNSGPYYMQMFGRGIVFYSLDDTELGPGPGFSLYLRAYLEGQSNDEILDILNQKAAFDYYDFNRRPQDQ